jgi:cell division protein FtsW
VLQYLRLRYILPIFDPQVKTWAIEARLLQWLTFLWLLVGLAVLLSASYPEGVAEHSDGFYFFKRQLLFIGIGTIGFNFLIRSSIEKILKHSSWFFFLFIGLILATVIGLGRTAGGATRWIPIGPFALQPSEFIKPLLILQSARLFGKWEKLQPSVRLGWLGIFAFLLLLILKQPNLSTTSLFGMTIWLIALAAGLPWMQLGLTAIGGVGVATLSMSINEYQRDRISFFLDPWVDPLNKGFQLIQSLLAISSGGWFGSGYGLSQQKLSYLPEQYTDFIFAVFAEEFGFIGSVVLLMMVLTYGTIALIVAIKCRQRTHRLIAIGVMVVFVGQSLLNIGVASGALPTTGLTLPFFSYGGSSVMASLLLAGLLIRVARDSDKAEMVTKTTTNPVKNRSS